MAKHEPDTGLSFELAKSHAVAVCFVCPVSDGAV